MYYPRVKGVFQYSLLILYQIHLERILQYASTLVMAPLPCNSQLHILPINIYDNFSEWHDFWKVQTIRYDFQISYIIQVSYFNIAVMDLWKQICTQRVTYVIFFTFFLYKWLIKLIQFDIFFQMWMCLLIDFVLKNVHVPFWKLQLLCFYLL